jgi:hypothetical protein
MPDTKEFTLSKLSNLIGVMKEIDDTMHDIFRALEAGQEELTGITESSIAEQFPKDADIVVDAVAEVDKAADSLRDSYHALESAIAIIENVMEMSRF